MDQWLDWSAFGFLALLSLLDGLRRVPAGALVLRRIAAGKWEPVEMREGYRLVSWWPPLCVTIVLDSNGRTDDLELKEMRPRVLLLHGMGLIALVALVVVVPVAMRGFGGMGFLLSLLIVLLLSGLIAGVSFYFSRAMGLTTRQRIMFALPRLNPFAAPAAGEALLERSLEGANPFAVAKTLMNEDDFAFWIRPMVYDMAQGGEVNEADALLQVVKHSELKGFVDVRPARVDALSPWCRRCGSEFGSSSTACPSCEIPLVK